MEQRPPRCRGCRHQFVVNYRNRGRSNHQQVYCRKPGCQEKSRRASLKAYRRSSPEDADQILVRVRNFRAKKLQNAFPESASRARPPLDDSKPSINAELPLTGPARDPHAVDALTHRLVQLSGLLASLIVNGECNEMTGIAGNVQPEP